MGNIQLSKKMLAAIALIIVLLLVFFVSCSTEKKSKKNSLSTPDGIFTPSSTTSPKSNKKNSNKKDSSETIPTYKRVPFGPSAQKYLDSQAATGTIDPSSPETYTSPKYEAILGGDSSSGVPRSELDNPKNSDLDETTFNAARQVAIEITKAQITGEGASKYPQYFNDENIPGTCISFVASNAGATSLPIPNDNRWIIAIIFWSAKCSADGKSYYSVSQQTQVYFTVDNGALTPRRLSEVPRS